MEESNCLERNVDRWSVLLEEAKERRFKIQIKINKLQKLKRAEDDKIARIEKNIRENQIKLHYLLYLSKILIYYLSVNYQNFELFSKFWTFFKTLDLFSFVVKILLLGSFLGNFL